MKKIPRILALGVLSMVSSAYVASAADYQWVSTASSQYWEYINSNWNQNSPWAGNPPGGNGPTASDNLDLAGSTSVYLSNGGSETTLKNYGINNITIGVAGQEIRGFSGVNALLTANSISLSGSGASFYISRGSNRADTFMGVNTASLSVGANTTLNLGRTTNAALLAQHFVVTGTTTVNGQVANSYFNRGNTFDQVNLGDVVLNVGGGIGLNNDIDSGVGAGSLTGTTAVAVRSLSGGGFLYGSNITNAGIRTANLSIETQASTNAVFSGTLANSSVGSGTNRLNITVSGSGRQAFTGGASTYTGTTSIQNATLAVAVLADGGSASSIGASGTAATNLIIDGGTLEYIGNTASTNRLFTIGANGATLNASGAGAITYSATNVVTYSAAGNNSLGFSGSGSGVFAGRINNHATSGVTSVSKSGSGTWTLSGSNGYTGATNITGGKLIVDGFINASSGVNVGAGAVLGGHGRVSRISGAGTVAAGNSPGILTATDIDASGGLDFTFEFTTQATGGVSVATFGNAASSGNDVLRLTDATPFEFSLTSSNTIAVDFSAVSLADGDRYLGGFYTDAGDFWSQIENATFTYTGINGFAITVSTVQQSANFGAGLVNGYITEFTVHAVPEPGAVALLGLSAVGFAMVLRRRRSAR